MRLYRAHGLSNDYLVLEAGPSLCADLVKAICDRHQGVGGDGILEPMDSAEGYGVRIWNPDGSLAEKSGNGLRIYAHWLHRRRNAPSWFKIDTGTDVVSCEVNDLNIQIAMGCAKFEPKQIPILAPDNPFILEIGSLSIPVVAVSIGNPHAVIFYENQPLDAVPWRELGPQIERHPWFPHRTNVQFAQVESNSKIHIRIWERGAGETLASGSSSCAAVAAAVWTGRVPPGQIQVAMPGGELAVTIAADFQLLLEGPVEPVGVIEVDEGWLRRRLQ